MTIKFLADESCDFAIVRFLRAANYDVLAIMEIASGESDANYGRCSLCAYSRKRRGVGWMFCCRESDEN